MQLVNAYINERGMTQVPGYRRGTVAVHREIGDYGIPMPRGRWVVTHQRTGLSVTVRHMTLSDARALAAGVDAVIAALGDGGVPGSGAGWDHGRTGKAIVRYLRAINERPNERLVGTRLLRVGLTRETALAIARDVIAQA